MSNRLWEKSNYMANIQYLIDIPLREYDITKCNINVLRDAGVLSEEQYQYYLYCSKDERSKAIGKLQGRDSRVTEILKAGIANARKVFMEINGLQDKDILAIRNDAITIMSDRPIIADITERVKFRLVGAYRSYYKIFSGVRGFTPIEFFYDYDYIYNKEVLDIKGLSDECKPLHNEYMLLFLKTLFYSAQIERLEDALLLLNTVHGNYLRGELDIGFYRELNSISRFRLKPEFSMYTKLYMDMASNYDKQYIDISYNDAVFREFIKIFSALYFRKR